MKELIFIFIAVFTLCSCSTNNENIIDNNTISSSSENIFGVWKIDTLYNNYNNSYQCNIDASEFFVLYPTSDSYITNFYFNQIPYNYNNQIGEFYIDYSTVHGYPVFNILYYEYDDANLILVIHGNIRNIKEFESNQIYTYKFKLIDHKHKDYNIWECIEIDHCKPFVIMKGSKIKLKYLGYDISEWTKYLR